jgi:hypothetical protein
VPGEPCPWCHQSVDDIRTHYMDCYRAHNVGSW